MKTQGSTVDEGKSAGIASGAGAGTGTVRQRAAEYLGGNADLHVPLTPSEAETLNNHFTYHPASPGQTVKYEAVTTAAKEFARCVLEWCPKSADRTFALRLIQQARMTANQSIALEGQAFPGA